MFVSALASLLELVDDAMPIGGRNCKLCCVCDESMGQQILLQATMAAAAR